MAEEATEQRQLLSRSNYTATIAGLYRDWKEKKEMIEEALNRVLREDLGDSGLPEVARYISQGGKRFRGFLTLLTAEALGADPREALDAAVAVELAQAASLALDDIIDGDRERRGRVAAWIMHGIPKTVLSSLLLVPVSQRLVEKLGFRALFHVIRAWESTVRGEILDAFHAEILPGEKYVEVTRLKTGALFKLATVLGVLVAKAPPSVEEALGRYGELLGVIYQIADDIVDYTRYLKGSAVMEPGLKHFEKWALKLGDDVIEAASTQLRRYISEAEYLAASVRYKSSKGGYLVAIPRFIALKMLSSEGLEHLLSEDES